jgi:hypothetical protein
MLAESGAIKPESAKELLREGNEILAIIVASINTKREQNS